MKQITLKDKIDHINKCEFHKGVKLGECPLISKKEAVKLRKQYNTERWNYLKN